MADLNFTVNRNGSTPASTYNWQLNADNRGDDYYFESIAYPSDVPGEYIDSFIEETRNGGAQPLVTIPIMGRVATLDLGRTSLAGFPAALGAQQDCDPFWPDACNGVFLNGNFAPSDPSRNSIAPAPNHVEFQQGWVQHLVNMWGTAAGGGLRYYLLDNEPGIWHVAHRDMHPVGATMQEVFDKMRDHALMIKQVDPGAQVVGPEEWNWWGYFYSGFDEWLYANGDDTQPEFNANGPFIPWLLRQFRDYQQNTGLRLLDVLSVHYYPQEGEFEPACPPQDAIERVRNRSTRALWDPNYVEQGCIAAVVRLLPLLKEWVAANYPGTKIALHEYNWGGDAEMSGATAQADILGILGR
jgi:hypothetical protein